MAQFFIRLFRLNHIKGNIIKVIFVMGVISLLLGIYAFYQTSRIQDIQLALEEKLMPAQKATARLNRDISKAYQLLIQYSATGNEKYRSRYDALWLEEIDPAIALLDTLAADKQIELSGSQLQALRNGRNRLIENGQLVLNQVKQQKLAGKYPDNSERESIQPVSASLQFALSGRFYPEMEALSQMSEALEIQFANELKLVEQEIAEEIFWLKWSGFAALVLSFVLGFPMGYFLVAQLYRSLYHIKSVVKQFRLGNVQEEIKESKNETHHITGELRLLADELKQIKQLALAVGEGNFDNQITVFNNQGNLGESLARMKNSLSQVAKADRQRNWINEGFAHFGEVLRSNNNTIANLTDAALHYLITYVKANQGALFLVEGNEQEQYLEMAACYAYERKKYLEMKILKGEGLCGQAWQENDMLMVTDIPDDYVKIKSGLGTSNPAAILVLPLHSNEETVGVLELASFEPFQEFEIEFIRKACDNLAAAVNNARTNERTIRLLEESQQLTEAMRAQEEEMRQNMEELEATQEEMERAQAEMLKKEQNLNSVINNTKDTIFAIDTEYRITVVNQVLQDKYKAQGVNLETGVLIKDIISKSAWEKWKARYDRALNGEQFSLIEETKLSNGSLSYSQTYHNPIRNEEGRIVGVSVVSRDVTEMMLGQQEAARKHATLSSLIDNTDDTFFALDKEYRILVANLTLKNRFKASGITLEEGDYIFDKLSKDQIPFWKEKYDRSLAGESFSFVQDRQVGDKTLYIEVSCNPIVDTDGKIMGTSVVSKDKTYLRQAQEETERCQEENQKLREALGIDSNQPKGK